MNMRCIAGKVSDAEFACKLLNIFISVIETIWIKHSKNAEFYYEPGLERDLRVFGKRCSKRVAET